MTASPNAIAAALVLLAIPCALRAAPRPPGTRPDTPLKTAQVVFSASTGLANGWQDYGWAPRKFAAGAPASVDMSSYGGWIIGNPNPTNDFGGLKITLQAPPKVGDFLEVRVAFPHSEAFPEIKIGPRHRRDLKDGRTEIWLSLSELNPRRAPFDRMMLRAWDALPKGTRIKFEEIAWTAPETGAPGEAAAPAEPLDVQMTVSCQQPGHRISPMIYGIAFKPSHDARDTHQWKLGASARRWGGNPTSRYNWMLGNAWNTASDWFFRNVNYTPNPKYTYDYFLDDNMAHGVQTALTVPTLGWVAKDTESVGFPASVFGQQQYMEGPRTGNGIGKDGKPLKPGPPTLTSIPAPPAFVEKWVRAIRAVDARDRGRSVHQYILDNEPALWNHTHRDVHPEPVTYDELLEKMIQYGSAVRRADPEAVIAGPAEWGWPGYFFSARDQAVGFTLKPDRLAHGDKPLLPWLLGKLRQHRQKTGERILDVVDLHYYPQHPGAGMGASGKTDPYSAAMRIRSTRSLWDPSYTDESWIKDKVRLIPRLKQWIAEEDPGLGISIGEWNFGAEGHMSGGLATAEALGRFGQGGLTSAFYWDYPADQSPAFWAFRAYRNFDWKGGKFLDWSVPASSTHQLSSIFASRNEAGDRLVLVLLNFEPAGPLKARLDLSRCGTVLASKAYSYDGDPSGFKPAPAPDPGGGAGALEQQLEAYSMTVLDLQVQPAQPARRGTK